MEKTIGFKKSGSSPSPEAAAELSKQRRLVGALFLHEVELGRSLNKTAANLWHRQYDCSTIEKYGYTVLGFSRGRTIRYMQAAAFTDKHRLSAKTTKRLGIAKLYLLACMRPMDEKRLVRIIHSIESPSITTAAAKSILFGAKERTDTVIHVPKAGIGAINSAIKIFRLANDDSDDMNMGEVVVEICRWFSTQVRASRFEMKALKSFIPPVEVQASKRVAA